MLVGLCALSVVDRQSAPPPAGSLGLSGQGIDRVMERHRCSTTGFGPEVEPAEAMVRFDDGRTRVVSFDRGWASFTGRKPGELVAVCLGEPSHAMRG